MLLALLAVILSVGAINALIPILVIIILIAAAAGATRGFSFFNVFGNGLFAGSHQDKSGNKKRKKKFHGVWFKKCY